MDTERSTIKATITTDHPASSYGMPVIVLEDGGALDYTSAILLDYLVEKINEAEMPLLKQWQHNMPPIDINPAATLGRKGGSVKSLAKSDAATARNAKRKAEGKPEGGRPKKVAE